MNLMDLILCIVAGLAAVTMPSIYAAAVPKSKKKTQFTLGNVIIMVAVLYMIFKYFSTI